MSLMILKVIGYTILAKTKSKTLYSPYYGLNYRKFVLLKLCSLSYKYSAFQYRLIGRYWKDFTSNILKDHVYFSKLHGQPGKPKSQDVQMSIKAYFSEEKRNIERAG